MAGVADAASDGSFWARCPDSPCVRVSRDQGMSWQERPLPQAGTATDWVATVDGQTVYAAVSDDSTLTSLRAASTALRSTDGGLSYRALEGAPTSVTVLYRTGRWLVAAPAFEERETPDLSTLAYVSVDDGGTWIPVPQP